MPYFIFILEIILKGLFAVVFTAVFVAGCATPHVVEKKKLSDNQLNCQQLAAQVDQADEFKRKAQSEKGVTGTNAAAAILFWPAMIATYQNANEASAAADARKEHLTDLYNKKGCK